MAPKVVEELAVAPREWEEEGRRRRESPNRDPNSPHVGTLVGFDGDGSPLVDFPANPFLEALPARSCSELSDNDVGCDIVILFEGGDFARPLLVGCLRTAACVTLQPARDVEIDPQSLSATEAAEDVRVTAARSLTLRCGKASITLTREGRVFVNGDYVETRASGTNRIQGGAVRIN